MSWELIFNDESSNEYNVYPVDEKVSVPAPEKDISVIEVPGRDGALHVDNKRYKPIDIPIKLNFINYSNKIDENFRIIKKWLRGSGILSSTVLAIAHVMLIRSTNSTPARCAMASMRTSPSIRFMSSVASMGLDVSTSLKKPEIRSSPAASMGVRAVTMSCPNWSLYIIVQPILFDSRTSLFPNSNVLIKESPP